MQIHWLTDRDELFTSDLEEIGAMANADREALKGFGKYPSAKYIARVDWQTPENLTVLIGLAKQEIAHRTELLTGYPASRQESDKQAERDYKKTGNRAYMTDLNREQTLAEFKADRWCEFKTWARRECRVKQALEAWIDFAEHFIGEQQESTINALRETVWEYIARIENRKVYWCGSLQSLETYLNASQLFGKAGQTKAIQWAKQNVVMTKTGKTANPRSGHISDAENRSKSAYEAMRKLSLVIDRAIQWHCRLTINRDQTPRIGRPPNVS